MSFSFYLLLSFIVGGAWVALSSFLSERYGARTGGYFAGIPSTVVVAFAFIALSQGRDVAYDVTTVFPAAFAGSVVFLLSMCTVRLRVNSFALQLMVALSLWGGFEYLLYLFDVRRFDISMAIWLLVLMAGVRFAVAYGREASCEGGWPIPDLNKWAFRRAIARAVLGGSVVTLAVLMTDMGGPLIGGIFSAFPAVYLSQLVVLRLAYGKRFDQILGPMASGMALSGMLNVVTFAIAFRLLIHGTGVSVAIVIAFLGSLVVARLGFVLLARLGGKAA